MKIILILPIFIFLNCSKKIEYLTLSDVIPDAVIVSRSEGIVEYKGKRFILGGKDFKKKKEIIERLKLLEIEGSVEIDLHFKRQVIVRKR